MRRAAPNCGRNAACPGSDACRKSEQFALAPPSVEPGYIRTAADGRMCEVVHTQRKKFMSEIFAPGSAGLPEKSLSVPRNPVRMSAFLGKSAAVGGFQAFPICPVRDAHSVIAVIDRLKPRHPTLRLFKRH